MSDIFSEYYLFFFLRLITPALQRVDQPRWNSDAGLSDDPHSAVSAE